MEGNQKHKVVNGLGRNFYFDILLYDNHEYRLIITEKNLNPGNKNIENLHNRFVLTSEEAIDFASAAIELALDLMVAEYTRKSEIREKSPKI